MGYRADEGKHCSCCGAPVVRHRHQGNPYAAFMEEWEADGVVIDRAFIRPPNNPRLVGKDRR